MNAPPNVLDSLDRHWAVKVVTPEDRAAAIQYGMSVLTRLCAGGDVDRSVDLPDFVVPLAGAYVIAASDWLDFEGAARLPQSFRGACPPLPLRVSLRARGRSAGPGQPSHTAQQPEKPGEQLTRSCPIGRRDNRTR